jgi:hypothetical protein
MGGLLAPLLNDPSLAVEYARGLLQGMEKARFLSAAAGAAVAKDPQLALGFGEGLEGKERSEFMIGLASDWGRSAGDSAWAWALQEPDAALRNALQSSIIEGWVLSDPESSALHLGQIADSEARKRAIHALGFEWGASDTQAAFAWANSLPDPAERDAAMSAISSAAPVGIGVVLKMGEEGYPMISDVVPGSPASASGTLAGGYQIAAISNGNGGFIDLRNKSMEEVVTLIRGAPGSNVWLQVVQPGGTGTSAAPCRLLVSNSCSSSGPEANLFQACSERRDLMPNIRSSSARAAFSLAIMTMTLVGCAFYGPGTESGRIEKVIIHDEWNEMEAPNDAALPLGRYLNSVHWDPIKPWGPGDYFVLDDTKVIECYGVTSNGSSLMAILVVD